MFVGETLCRPFAMMLRFLTGLVRYSEPDRIGSCWVSEWTDGILPSVFAGCGVGLAWANRGRSSTVV